MLSFTGLGGRKYDCCPVIQTHSHFITVDKEWLQYYYQKKRNHHEKTLKYAINFINLCIINVPTLVKDKTDVE